MGVQTNGDKEADLSAFRNYLIHVRGLSPRTAHEYCADVGSFLSWMSNEGRHLPGYPLDEATRQDVEDWLAHQAKRGLSPATRARRLASLRAYYSKHPAANNSNPASGIKSPKLPKKVAKPLRTEELESLVKEVKRKPRDLAMILLMSQSGLRVSEVLGLRWGDIDLRQRTILVHGKGGKQRVVPMDTETKRALIKWKAITGYSPSHPVTSDA